MCQELSSILNNERTVEKLEILSSWDKNTQLILMYLLQLIQCLVKIDTCTSLIMR